MERRHFLRRSALFTLAAAALPGLAAASPADNGLTAYVDDVVLRNGTPLRVRVTVLTIDRPAEALDSKLPIGVSLLVSDKRKGETFFSTVYELTRTSSARKGDISSATFTTALERGDDLLKGILPSSVGMQMEYEKYVLIELEKGHYSRLNAPTRDGCFLTTACTAARHLPDDCHELTVLRGLRDGYLQASVPGSTLVQEYYRLAPRLVQQVNARANHAAIWSLVYTDLVQPVVALIETGQHTEAVAHYTDYVRWMQQAFTPELA